MRSPGDIGASAVRVVLVVAAMSLLAATVAVISIGDGGTDEAVDPASADEEPADTTTPSSTIAIDDLDGAAHDLAQLLAAGRETTYHARYEGRAAEGTGDTLVLESWSKDGRFRQDTRVEVGGEPFHRANFLLDDRAVACTRAGDDAWTCQQSDTGQVEGTDILGGGSLDQLARAAVGEEPGEVDGRQARCFIITYDAQTTELCTSTEGVPLRIRSQTSELVIDVLESTVDDSVFELPAAPA